MALKSKSITKQVCAKSIMSTSCSIMKTRVIHHKIFDRFHLATSSNHLCHLESSSQYKYFSIHGVLSYSSFCNDFGPMSLSCISLFCSIVDEQLKQHPGVQIALHSIHDCRSLSNNVFLIGSYMIMRLGMTVDDVHAKFENMNHWMASFRDASPGKPDFDLYVKDCWSGLLKAKNLGWFNLKTFDPHEHDHYGNMLNGNIHQIIPGKFLAFCGPKDLNQGEIWKDAHDTEGRLLHRNFSPSYYIELFREFGVKAIIRLNDSSYDPAPLRAAGVAVADMPFPEAAAPPAAVVGKFLAVAEGLDCAIAVHCEHGLGRTGTLIALYMMKHFDFTALEAIAWLRLVRPGSILGRQQHFLCAKEAAMRRAGAATRRRPGMPEKSTGWRGVEAAESFINAAGAQEKIRCMQQLGQIPPPPESHNTATACASEAGAAQQLHFKVLDSSVCVQTARDLKMQLSLDGMMSTDVDKNLRLQFATGDD